MKTTKRRQFSDWISNLELLALSLTGRIRTRLSVNVKYIQQLNDDLTHVSLFLFCMHLIRMIQNARSTHNLKIPLLFKLLFFRRIFSLKYEICFDDMLQKDWLTQYILIGSVEIE